VALTERPADTRPALSPRAVTSTDALKALALLLMLFDHWAHYVAPEQDWMHALGRGALPIFFFLIGFARTERVPWFWLAAGVLLTALDWLRMGRDIDDVTFNILLSFAVIRWAMPLVERHVMGAGVKARHWRTALLVALLLGLSHVADMVIDYGSSGWLLALVGRAHRLALESGPDKARDPAWLGRRLIGAIATLFFVANEIHDYEFATVDAFVAAGSIIAASALLLRFRRVDLGWQPPAALADMLRFCGRRSLEIYIAQILGLMALGTALGVEPDSGDETQED
jgi:hypothetical protein